MKQYAVTFYKLVVCLAVLGASVARADNTLYTGVGFNNGDQGVTLGIEFVPAVDITVTSLGVYDGGSDNMSGPSTGLQTPRDVGLYEKTGPTTGTLLASTTVDNTGVLANGFRYLAIAPTVQLTAGQTYVVAAHYAAGFTGDKVNASLPNMQTWPLVTLNGGLAEAGAALAFPTLAYPANPNDYILSANMLFNATAGPVGNGDINQDGNVDAADVMLGTRIVTGALVPSATQLVAGDVAPYTGGQSYPDNQFDISDLLLISRIALGLFTL